MKINKISRLLVAVVIIGFSAVSCTKNEIIPQELEKKIDICITGDFNELSPDTPATKAIVQNTFRMTWKGTNADATEKVYVFGKASGASDISCLGTLSTIIVPDTGNRLADLSGTITEPEAGTKLTLVYSPELQSEPSLVSGKLSIDLSSQTPKNFSISDDVTFVAYSTVDYGGAEASYRTAFNFATSILRVNVSNLTAYKSIFQATLGDIETECVLNISANAAPQISGSGQNNKTITRSLLYMGIPLLNTNDKGNAAFYIALPKISGNSNRKLTVTQMVSLVHEYPGFATGSAECGKLLNSIGAYQISSLSLDKTSMTMKIGDSHTLTATIVPTNDSNNGIVWTSSNTSVASVSETGEVIAKATGSAVITAVADGPKTATCTVYIPVDNATPGVFTVGPNPTDQVHFSKGNLYAKKVDDNWTWGFYGNQYEFCAKNMEVAGPESGPQRIVSDTETEIDLFTWGYDAEKSVNPVGTDYVEGHTTQTDKKLSRAEDWGCVFGGESSPWRTLSKEEWDYLTITRAMPNDRERFESLLYPGVIIDGINFCGCVLFPDGFTKQDTWKEEYTTWESLYDAGLVFLPATGLRDNRQQILLVGIYASYWTSSSCGPDDTESENYDEQAYLFHLDANNTNTWFRNHGNPVRLVSNCW